ncbi:MAG TPA: UPF0223 family protein [Bacillota bacterium]|nr:UPF0223 family protein [Bacillota bacterium]
MNYHYPLDESWTKQEVIAVVHFFTLVEKAYEHRVRRRELLDAYNIFKQIVPSKSEEKKFFAEFQKASGYSSYAVVKQARNEQRDVIKMSNAKP